MVIILGILGILCAVYGVIVMMVGSGTWFFAFWFVVAALLFLGAGAVHAGWWSSLPSIAKTAVVAVLIVLFAGFLGTQALIMKNFDDRGEEGLDYLVVLGAQVREGGPSLVLQYRLDTAYDYLMRNPETICIVTGGQGPNEPFAEADMMADYLIARGVDESRIIRETDASNTIENIAFSSAFFDPATDSVGIVTNNFHVFRGVGIARKFGYAHVCGIAAPTSPLYLPNNLVRESFSVAKDIALGKL